MRRNQIDEAFIGSWVSSLPFDSEDYLVEYTIRKVDSLLQVTAKDYRDGEQMQISEVKYDGKTLEFVSLMPSTGRIGLNRFSVKSRNILVSEFTFTVIDSLKRLTPERKGSKQSAARSTKRVTVRTRPSK